MKGIRSHIVLVGFMGSGKSTVGRLLAIALDLTFIDMDDYIESKEGRSIKEIFAKDGEPYFRELESRVLSEILSMSEKVIIATGGGAPCFNDNMSLINTKAKSIYLKVGRERLVSRLKNDTQRPLLQNKNEKELLVFVKTKLSEREAHYLQSDVTVRAADSSDIICKRLVKYILKNDL